jgi:hypothetical protein
MTKRTTLIGATLVTVLMGCAALVAAAALLTVNSGSLRQKDTGIQDPENDSGPTDTQDPKNNTYESGAAGSVDPTGAQDTIGIDDPQDPTEQTDVTQTLYVVPEPPFALAMISIFAVVAVFIAYKKSDSEA